METWNTFTSNDVVYTIFGAAGLASVIIVLNSALSKVNKREIDRAAIKEALLERIKQQENSLKGNLEPEENVLADK